LVHPVRQADQNHLRHRLAFRRMEEVRAGNSNPHATDWRLTRYVVAFLGAVAVAVLIVAGVSLLSAIDGPECHGEFPVCTTPSQQSARQTFAVLCGLGVVAYVLAVLPALKARRFHWSYVVIGVVIVLAVLILITDPGSHLRAEAGSDQWFVASCPL
jgi:cell division protein FtsW (lipid II flippase)